MKRLLRGSVTPLVLFLLLPAFAYAQVAPSPPAPMQVEPQATVPQGVQGPAVEVDTSEIQRRILMGLTVERLGGIQNTEESVIAAVAAPPASDAHKWFISLVVRSGEAESELLKRDWLNAASPTQGNDLRQFAIADNPQLSWAHFNIYDLNDPKQSWRDKNWAIKKTPAIIVQAPLNGSYGPKGMIVCHLEGYKGDPNGLAKKVGSWIGEYARTHHATPVRSQSLVGAGKVQGPGHEAGEQCYPYCPPNQQQPAPSGPLYVVQQPDLPPSAQPQVPIPAPAAPSSGNFWTIVVGLASAVFGAGLVATVGGIVALILTMVRSYRKSQGQTTLLSDEEFAKLKKALQSPGSPA